MQIVWAFIIGAHIVYLCLRKKETCPLAKIGKFYTKLKGEGLNY